MFGTPKQFTVLGRPFLGLNGGPTFRSNEAVSFIVLTENQEETDRYWNAIVGNGGSESACGWCKEDLSKAGAALSPERRIEPVRDQ